MFRRFILAAALAASLLVSSALAQVRVSGDWIALGDVAPVTGDAARVLVGPSPPPGQTLALDPVFLSKVAHQHGVALALPAGAPVWVTRDGAPRPAAAKAQAAPTPAAATSLPDAPPQPGWVLAPVRDLARGDTVAAEDLQWIAPPFGRTPPGAIRSAAAVIGLEVRRTLRAGGPLLEQDAKAPAVIRKGEPVSLVYARAGLRLTVEGKALGDAAAGDSVRILNTFTRRTLDAVAVAPGEARIQTR